MTFEVIRAEASGWRLRWLRRIFAHPMIVPLQHPPEANGG